MTIDRPERTNAVDYETRRVMVDALRRTDDDLAAGIASGADDGFCAGADLKGIRGGRRYG